MPGESGLSFVRHASEEYEDTAAIMVTATDDPLVAEAVFGMGAYDYVTKPIQKNRILTSVANALRRRELEIANRAYREDSGCRCSGFYPKAVFTCNIVGESEGGIGGGIIHRSSPYL